MRSVDVRARTTARSTHQREDTIDAGRTLSWLLERYPPDSSRFRALRNWSRGVRQHLFSRRARLSDNVVEAMISLIGIAAHSNGSTRDHVSTTTIANIDVVVALA